MHRRQFLAHSAVAAAAPWLAARCASAAQPAPDQQLARHRIAAVETRAVPLPWPRLVGRNAKLDVHGHGPTITAVVLRTDQGALGWGECAGGAQAINALRERVVGQSVADLFAPQLGIREPLWEPLDIALHDLAGVILDQPVWKMLGGDTPQQFPVYSGMIYFDDLTPVDQPPGIDQVLRNCEADLALGYRQLKVKIGRGNRWMPPAEGLQRDIDVLHAIVSAFPDAELLVDGNDGFTADSFLAFMQGIEGIPLIWIEEPFVEDEAQWRKVFDWTRLRGYPSTLLADGEQHNDYPLLERLEAAGILQVRLSDILGYGFTRWRALMPRLRATRTLASPHCWGSGLKTVYTAHLLAALGNAPTIEGVTCQHDHVDFGQNVIRDGLQQVSHEPGFGLRLRT